MSKTLLPYNVLEGAKERIAYTFDNFEKIYISFSGGKDSTLMLHLVMDEAIKRGRKIGCLFVDLEGRNWSDAKISKHLGMDADEVLRLTQITGLAEMFKDHEFTQAWEPEILNDDYERIT